MFISSDEVVISSDERGGLPPVGVNPLPLGVPHPLPPLVWNNCKLNCSGILGKKYKIFHDFEM